jgi:Tfp pilus assembly protein PilN
VIRVNLIKSEKKDLDLQAARPEGEGPAKLPRPFPSHLLIVAVLIAVGAFAFLLKRSTDQERGRIQAAQSEKRSLEPVLSKIDALGTQKLFLEKKIKLINDLKARQGEAVRLMETMSVALPEWVWLTDVRFGRRAIQIKGKALTNIQISDYMRNLEQSGIFDLVSLMGSNQKNQGGTSYQEFTITANVPGAAETPAVKAKRSP